MCLASSVGRPSCRSREQRGAWQPCLCPSSPCRRAFQGRPRLDSCRSWVAVQQFAAPSTVRARPVIAPSAMGAMIVSVCGHFTALAVRVNVVAIHSSRPKRPMGGAGARGHIRSAPCGQESGIAGPSEHRRMVIHDRPEPETHDFDRAGIGLGPADEHGMVGGGFPGRELRGEPGFLRHVSVLHAHTIPQRCGFVKRYTDNGCLSLWTPGRAATFCA
jgi:hypothetical protein